MALEQHQTYIADGRIWLEGSPANDAWKRKHKFLDRSFYAVDLDLVLIRRNPFAIVAVTDFKDKSNYPTNIQLKFSHVLAYDELVKLGIPVFIVCATWNQFSEPEFEDISIYQFVSGNPAPNPPEYQLEDILSHATLEEYTEWERQLRNEYKPRSTFEEANRLEKCISALARLKENSEKVIEFINRELSQ